MFEKFETLFYLYSLLNPREIYPKYLHIFLSKRTLELVSLSSTFDTHNNAHLQPWADFTECNNIRQHQQQQQPHSGHMQKVTHTHTHSQRYQTNTFDPVVPPLASQNKNKTICQNVNFALSLCAFQSDCSDNYITGDP